AFPSFFLFFPPFRKFTVLEWRQTQSPSRKYEMRVNRSKEIIFDKFLHRLRISRETIYDPKQNNYLQSFSFLSALLLNCINLKRNNCF
ncbi:unnamed protein product, partial [Larinioides sclopetarius]